MAVAGVIGVDIGIAAATGTAPPVDIIGALEPVGAGGTEPCSAAAGSTPAAAMAGPDTGGTNGACGGGADPEPVAFISPCDNWFAPAPAGWPVITP